MKHEIRNERSHKILALPRVQQRHVNYADVNTFFLCQNAPLPPDFLVIPAESVDAQHIQQVTGAKLFHKPPVLRSIEILAGLFIRENAFGRNAEFLKGGQLTRLVLIRA